jgi:predicted RNA binding protein YcfA (HicA-like mRNA interferase family)
MKLPRDVTGEELLRGLRRVGYVFERQAGSHMILHEIALQRSMSVESLLGEMKL